MRAHFLRASLILASLTTPAFAGPQGAQPTGSCGPDLSVHADVPFDPNETGAQPLDVRVFREFEAGGARWMAGHLTAGGRVLVASLDARNLLRVFDVFPDLERAVAAPTVDPGLVYTRGEWAEHPDGSLAVVLGDRDGYLHWHGVEPNGHREAHSSGTAKPLVPLATLVEAGEVWVLVGSGERVYRVRVLPAPARTHEYLQMNTETRFLRAARFHAADGTELIAAISRQTVEVFDLNGEHARYRGDLRDGEHAWTTWFEDRDQVLTVVHDRRLQLHFPVAERPPLELALGGRAAGRVHALTTTQGSTFILVPTETHAEVYRYRDGELAPWTVLPAAVSDHQKGITKAPNDRVYAFWTEEPAGGVPRFHMAQLARQMGTPEFSVDLRAGERVHHVQALDVRPRRQLIFVKTSARLLVLDVRLKD